MAWSILLGIPDWAYRGLERRQWLDHLLMSVGLIGYSMPIFWWGLILIMVFSVHIGWTPVAGRISAAYDVEPWSGFLLIEFGAADWASPVGGGAKASVFAGLVLGTIPVGGDRPHDTFEFARSFARRLRAHGQGQRAVVLSGDFRARAQERTPAGGDGDWSDVGTLLTGAVLTETLFSWPGVGRWLVASVLSRDYPVLQGGVLLLSVMIVLVNVGVDVLYTYLESAPAGEDVMKVAHKLLDNRAAVISLIF